MGVFSPSRSRSISRVKAFFLTKAAPGSHSSKLLASIERLPPDVFQEIARRIPLLRDILHLSLTSRNMRALLVSRLYRNIDLKTNRQCEVVLSMLLKHPDMARHVTKLIVHPNNIEWTAMDVALSESEVVDLLVRAIRYMPSLHTFFWDGVEMPDDYLWLVLRNSCPLLKSVGTSVGTQKLDPASNLYDFSDLTSFSFIVKKRSLAWVPDTLPNIEKIPKRFWEMIIERCPHLERLAIGGAAPSPRLFDIRHITHGRWPRLRCLTLGDLSIQPRKRQRVSWIKEPTFTDFLLAHPSLQKLNLQYAGGDNFPASLILPPMALPYLEVFTGTLKYVATLPNPSLIKSLSLTSLLYSMSSIPYLCSILESLTSLSSLGIWFDLSFNAKIDHDHGSLLRDLLSSCPQLSHLDLTCYTYPSFDVVSSLSVFQSKEFSQAIQDTKSVHLESFILTKLHSHEDGKMLNTAIQIIHDNPHLRKFTLRYSQDSWRSIKGIRPRQVGEYEVGLDEAGNPSTLGVYEWGVGSFSAHYTRRYKHKLWERPSFSSVRSLSSRYSLRSHKSSIMSGTEH
ncbi:uncharacterized protein EV420DRAFT_1259714 [Desarmillaria tabescens]|uniref:F-box domain-containing protein n=1 Tax=Armillaria tabescens TaxID=1929756 RepID=A0AA39NME2_ARMTA|nr:uncharacterized protein EV420DRAFT_1259714 [Desarmillaria tabescens]KAK0468083.1 hypothetical protein EV420DRAFT_1259714 [Desarmillaria tabescens]